MIYVKYPVFNVNLSYIAEKLINVKYLNSANNDVTKNYFQMHYMTDVWLHFLLLQYEQTYNEVQGSGDFNSLQA